MTKLKLQLFLIVICAIWNSAKGQSYSVESFEGPRVKIYLTDKCLTAKSWYCAKISCATDCLFLTDYNGIKKVSVLSHKFLEIVYDVRGGTGSEFRNTVILSVRKNKINVALLTNSFAEAFGGDIDRSLYAVKFNIIGNNPSDFKMVADIYDRQKSSSYPQKNYVKNKNVILSFDSGQNIFYNTYKSMNRSFTISDPKTGQSKEQQVSGSIPMTALAENYYFINGEWYRSSNGDNLFKDYYKQDSR